MQIDKTNPPTEARCSGDAAALKEAPAQNEPTDCAKRTHRDPCQTDIRSVSGAKRTHRSANSPAQNEATVTAKRSHRAACANVQNEPTAGAKRTHQASCLGG